MQTILHRVSKASFKVHRHRSAPSLSTYFPAGSQYFYGYPAGEASGFLNRVPPEVEELVAARAFSCAGPSVSIIAFAATSSSEIDSKLIRALDIPELLPEQTILLPEAIDYNLRGTERNQAIRESLLKLARPGNLIMAQPFAEDVISDYFQIPVSLTTWLNDKNNLEQYIDSAVLPKRLGIFDTGRDFVDAAQDLKLPYVAKVSSSSSGDGVYICKTQQDVETAVAQLTDVGSTILVERCIDVKKNYGVHFGIPHDKSRPIDILGVNEQLTTPEGEFLGGIIHDTVPPLALKPVIDYLLHNALPRIREMGWYGIGGFDVLLDENDNPYFIDCNFRMTGMSAYHFLVQNKKIMTPLVSFSGVFKGSQAEFENIILPLAGSDISGHMLQVISLTNHDDNWRFNAAIMLPKGSSVRGRVQKVLDTGIESAGLEQLLTSASSDLN